LSSEADKKIDKHKEMEAARKYLEDSVAALTGQSPELAVKYQELLDLFERRYATARSHTLITVIACAVFAALLCIAIGMR
jgi:hypothetical protein